jgi:hypothetical protein
MVMDNHSQMPSFTFSFKVDHGYYIMDSFVGYVMFIIIALLSFLGVPAILQVIF